MKFSDILNDFIQQIGCTSKEISVASGLSVAQISKYRNGKRTPRENSEQFKALSEGLFFLAKNNGIEFNEEEILNQFKTAMQKKEDVPDVLSENFRFLVTQLKINMSDLSSFMNYDSSFLSKIKNNDRKPSNANDFCSDVGKFISKRFNNPGDRILLASVLGGSEEQYRDEKTTEDAVYNYLISEHTPSDEVIESFLSSLNKTVISQNNQSTLKKLPSIPKTFNRTKLYSGLSGMKAAESDFFKYTILSSSKKDVFIHSEMGMNEVDNEQKSKLTSAVEMLISKGIHLTLIHNIYRPIEEMLTGLEVWLPLYMTGMVNSFYFEEPLSYEFPQILCTSGVAAMQGECILSNQELSTFIMTTNPNQLEYFFQKRNYMLSNALPLIKFYSDKNEKDYNSFIKNSSDYSEVYEIKKPEFPNISFTVNSNEWISVNRIVSEPLHFIVFNKRLINAIEVFLQN